MRSCFRAPLAISLAIVAGCETQPPTDVASAPELRPQLNVMTVVYNGQEYLAIPDTDSPSDYFSPTAQIAGHSLNWVEETSRDWGLLM